YSRSTIPMACRATEASRGPGSPASTARARVRASLGRDSASGRSSTGPSLAGSEGTAISIYLRPRRGEGARQFARRTNRLLSGAYLDALACLAAARDAGFGEPAHHGK